MLADVDISFIKNDTKKYKKVDHFHQCHIYVINHLAVGVPTMTQKATLGDNLLVTMWQNKLVFQY